MHAQAHVYKPIISMKIFEAKIFSITKFYNQYTSVKGKATHELHTQLQVVCSAAQANQPTHLQPKESNYSSPTTGSPSSCTSSVNSSPYSPHNCTLKAADWRLLGHFSVYLSPSSQNSLVSSFSAALEQPAFLFFVKSNYLLFLVKMSWNHLAINT
jgi:hypothetical protein